MKKLHLIQKLVTKQLLEFLYSMSENCLKYYKVNKSAIDTASANQANKPIYIKIL